MLTRGQYPYKWLWTFAGDKCFEAEGEIKFHRCMPTTYYYSLPLSPPFPPGSLVAAADAADSFAFAAAARRRAAQPRRATATGLEPAPLLARGPSPGPHQPVGAVAP